MTCPITYTETIWQDKYSEILDVRSPNEFAEDHLPQAINLPVLDNQERAEVGTLYAQDSFAARKLGATLTAQNIVRHLQGHLADKPRTYQPLIYCWRGGQRSRSLALVLSEIGWRVTLLIGGYKTYRHQVQTELKTLPIHFSYQVLCAPTGSGKTLVLQKLQDCGAQILDLEHLAHHRGSLLGSQGQQPSQKYFETLLLEKLQQFDPQKPIWIEAESSKIGQLHLPKTLLRAMSQGNCIELQVPLDQRVNYIISEYPQFIEQPALLKNQLAPLCALRGKALLQTWYDLIDHQDWHEFVSSILQEHYDPTYQHGLKRQYPTITHTLTLSNFSQTALQTLITQLWTL